VVVVVAHLMFLFDFGWCGLSAWFLCRWWLPFFLDFHVVDQPGTPVL